MFLLHNTAVVLICQGHAYPHARRVVDLPQLDPVGASA